MVRIADIDAKKLKRAQGFLEALELLELTEEDLLMLKRIPDMMKELAELREFKESVMLAQRNSASAEQSRKLNEYIIQGFGGKVEEFDPYGRK